MAHAFDEFRMEALMVAHFCFNKQSKRVIEKLGFEHRKHLAEACVRYDGAVLDDEIYTMTREQYQERYRKTLCVNEKEYTIRKLLGKGKGGYSYLASDGKNSMC